MLILSNYLNFIFFNFLEKSFNNFYNYKISNNFTSLIHASGSTILSLRYLLLKNDKNYTNLISYSSSFFAYDILFLLRNWENKTINYAYFYHHLASIYLMYQNPSIYKGGHFLFLGELSNIPSYFVYYYKKKPGKEKLVKKLKWIQFFLYSFIRVPIVTLLLKDIYFTNKRVNYTPLIVGTPIYFMGLIWTKKLYNKL